MATLKNKLGMEYPSTLYKYGSNFDFLQELIKNNELYFNNAEQLNDVFDIRYVLSPMYINSPTNDALKSINPNWRKILSHPTILKKSNIGFVEKLRKFALIYCMTSLKDNMALWGYYGGAYNGFMIEFDMRYAPDDMRSYTYPIIYQDEIPEVKNYDDLQKVSITKFKDWKWEHEYRAVYSDMSVIDKSYDSEFSRRIKFNHKLIRSITFGYKVTEELIKEISKLCKTHNLFSTIFYKTHLNITGMVTKEWDENAIPHMAYDQSQELESVVQELIANNEMSKEDIVQLYKEAVQYNLNSGKN